MKSGLPILICDTLVKNTFSNSGNLILNALGQFLTVF